MAKIAVILYFIISTFVYCDFIITDKNIKDTKNLVGQWKLTLDNDFDKTKINSMYDVNVPQHLKGQLLNKIGLIWYYTVVNFDTEQKKNMILIIGRVDDEEEVFFNGEKVGETKAVRYSNGSIKSKYDMKRYYFIPKDIINFNGKNDILIKINNIVSDGGIYGKNVGLITLDSFLKEYLFSQVMVLEFSDWIYLFIVGVALYLFLYNLTYFIMKKNYPKLYLSILSINFAFFAFEKLTTRSIFFGVDDDFFEKLVFANVIISIFFYNQFIMSLIKIGRSNIYKFTQAANVLFFILIMLSRPDNRYIIFYFWTVILMIQLIFETKKMWESTFSRKGLLLTGIIIWMITIIHDILYNLNIMVIFDGNLSVIGFIALMISVSLNGVFENMDMSEELKKLNIELKDKIDIREKEIKLIQEEMIRKEKMVMIAEMGAETIHEVKNSIAPVLTMSQILKVDIADYYENHDEVLKEEIDDNIATIEVAAKQANFVIMSFLNYSRIDSGEKKEFDIKDSLDMSVNFLKRRLKFEGVKLSVDKNEEVYYVFGEKGKLTQVFTNIIMNACDALAEDGPPNKKINIALKKENKFIIVEIEDNGPGIPGNIKDKIFEPFYTTKKEGKGTGLGMSVSLSIVKEMNGEMRVESVPGKGAKFIIMIPEFEISEVENS